MARMAAAWAGARGSAKNRPRASGEGRIGQMTKTRGRKARPANAGIREDPLDAAARLFRKQGFAATTVRQIAKQAGMLPGSLHYRFPSKEALLLALMERAIER